MTWHSKGSYKMVRDIVLLIAGLTGILHETLVVENERPTLLMLFAAMIGLPAFLRKDEGS